MTTFTSSVVSDTPADATALPVVNLHLRPGTVLPSRRLRPGLLAEATVVSGTVAFAVGGFDLDAESGAVVQLDPADDPAIWNTGESVAHVRATLRLPSGLSEADTTRIVVATEAMAALGSARDVTGRAGDGPVRHALEDELGDLADLVRRAELPAKEFLAV